MRGPAGALPPTPVHYLPHTPLVKGMSSSPSPSLQSTGGSLVTVCTDVRMGKLRPTICRAHAGLSLRPLTPSPF
jgi:hypothetical protein